MISLWRGNSYTEIRGASPDMLARLRRHLAIPVEPDRRTKLGTRFGSFFSAVDEHGERTFWGSLLHGQRIAAGLTPHAVAILQHYKQACDVRDVRVRPQEQLPLWSVRGTWRRYQDVVHERILDAHVAVVDAPPRSGKTLMAARAIDTLNLNTLYLAPSVAIVKQTYGVMRSFFGDDLVARLDGEATSAERDIGKQIVVSTVQSALAQPKEFFDTRDVLIVDEFHHGAAESYHRINQLAEHIYYRLCFTGTHFRTGEDGLAMEAVCSNVVASIPIGYLVEGGWLATPRVIFSRVEAPRVTSKDFAETYENGIVGCEKRNKLIAFIAKSYASSGIPCIVLAKRRWHADRLGSLIDDSVVVKGGENALTSDAIKEFRAGRIPVIVGTTVLGEGVDLPNAGAVVYASAGAGSVQQIQGYFRPLTGQAGKTLGYVHDFKDIQHPTLVKHSRSRINMAKNCLPGYVVEL